MGWNCTNGFGSGWIEQRSGYSEGVLDLGLDLNLDLYVVYVVVLMVI